MSDTRDIEVSRGIVVNPQRLGGVPTIKGRRISARMVADYTDEGMEELLHDDYDITDQQIADAQLWAKRGRPGS